MTNFAVAVQVAGALEGPVDHGGLVYLGVHLQLDPTLNLDSLNLASRERVIARALQEYGMYLGDSGGGIGLPIVHAYSFAGNPYIGLLPDTGTIEHGVLLDRIAADRFRVLQMTLTSSD